jgi:hypothetical protein
VVSGKPNPQVVDLVGSFNFVPNMSTYMRGVKSSRRILRLQQQKNFGEKNQWKEMTIGQGPVVWRKANPQVVDSVGSFNFVPNTSTYMRGVKSS